MPANKPNADEIPTSSGPDCRDSRVRQPPALPQDKASLFDSVQAILAENCLSCHGAAQMAGLDLRQRESFLKGGSRGPALVPGKAEDSLLFQAAAHIGELQMPPESPRLPKEEAGPHPPMDRLGRRLGRQQRRRRPGSGGARLVVVPKAAAAHALPLVGGNEWQGNPIDAFVLAKLREKGLPTAPPADKRTLIRRAYFDLIGLPPTPEQVDRFLKDDSPRAFQSVVNELLGSPHYGERWGRHWLDVVRYADSAGIRNRCLLSPCLALPGLRHQVLQ